MNKHKKTHNNKDLINRKRTLSRLMAIQIFYQFEFYEEQQDINVIKNNVIDNYILDQEDEISSFRGKIDIDLLESLLSGISLGLTEIDFEISQFLKDGWDLEKLPDIALYILRFGAFELKFMRDVPLKVVIDEYVEISSTFFEDKKVTFINGTLENMAKSYRSEEFEKIKNIKKNG